MKFSKSEVATYVIQAVLVSGILFSGFGLGIWPLGIPINCEGDALHYLAVARSLADDGGWWQIARLSAPFQLPMVMFPFCGTFEFGLLKLFSIFLSEPGAIVNSVYIASFFFTASAACFCLRLLGLRRLTSLTVGILYAFLPGAIYRNTAHLMLVYYFVPFAATAAMLLLSNRLEGLKPGVKLALGIGTALVGLSYIYTAFFGCFFLCVAGVVNFLRTRRFYGLAVMLALVGLIGLTSLVSIVPALTAWKQEPAASATFAGTKRIYDADAYGLKVRHLLTPRRDHPLAPFRAFANQTLDQFPLDNENVFAALGAFGAVGCLLLLLHFFCSHWIRSIEEAAIFEAAACLCLAAILLASIGGFGSMFNFFVSTEIRCYNRISVYIAFFAFFGAAFLMERLFHRRHIAVFGLVCGATVYLGIFDQASFDYIKSLRERSARQYAEVKPFVAQVEQILPRGAKIYQLPYTPYPNTPLVEKMVAHSHLLAYAVSHHLHWSWPTLSGVGIAFNQRLENLSPNALVETLERFGFSALWIDTTAYADRSERQLVDLEAITGTKRIISSEGRYALITLPRKAANFVEGMTEAQYRDTVAEMLNVRPGDVIDFSARGRSQQYLISGWSTQEPNFRWSEGSSAQLEFIFGSPPTSDLLLIARATGFVTERNPVVRVVVLANDTRVGEWKFGGDDGGRPLTCHIARSLFQQRTKLKITFEITGAVSPQTLGLSGDPRVLGIALEEIRFANVD